MPRISIPRVPSGGILRARPHETGGNELGAGVDSKGGRGARFRRAGRAVTFFEALFGTEEKTPRQRIVQESLNAINELFVQRTEESAANLPMFGSRDRSRQSPHGSSAPRRPREILIGGPALLPHALPFKCVPSTLYFLKEVKRQSLYIFSLGYRSLSSVSKKCICSSCRVLESHSLQNHQAIPQSLASPIIHQFTL